VSGGRKPRMEMLSRDPTDNDHFCIIDSHALA
jgi:hypothetical protein